MREFRADDGRSWSARMEKGGSRSGDLLSRVGWEVVLFERGAVGGEQRFVHRPAGWLASASDRDLAEALREGQSIRARWGMAQA
jgi:hypothetical protein